ncbi:UNVERIFIED_CONTAM: hypothetical protein FKN15_075391 [Acipenser sinensis]
MSVTENEKKQHSALLKCLWELLDALVKGHKPDIPAYSSGHLNHANLPKLLVKKSNMPQWEGSQQEERRPPQKQISKAVMRKMTDTWADFTINTSLITDQPSVASPLFRYPHPKQPIRSPLTQIGNVI